VQEQVLDILPLVSEVNAISEELNKYQMFDVVLMTVAGNDGTTTKGTKSVNRQRYCHCHHHSVCSRIVVWVGFPHGEALGSRKLWRRELVKKLTES